MKGEETNGDGRQAERKGNKSRGDESGEKEREEVTKGKGAERK